MLETPSIWLLLLTTFLLGLMTAGAVALFAILYRTTTRLTDHDRLMAKMRIEVETFRREVDRALRAEITSTYGAWVIANPTGHIIDAGGAIYRLTQRRPVELIGQPISLLIPTELRSRHQEAFQQTVATGRLRQDAIAGQLLRADGTQREVVVRLKQVQRNDTACIRADLFEVDRDDLT